MKSALDRVAAFRAKMQGEALSSAASRTLLPVNGEDTESMNAFITRVGQVVALELQIKQLLNGLGTSTILYPCYMAFGCGLWALKMRGLTATGPTSIFQTEANVRKAIWVGRGLDPTALEGIIAIVTAP